MHFLKEFFCYLFSLLANRQKRLKEEQKRIITEIESIKQGSQKMTKEHNSYLQLLNKNAPFEQGLAIKEDINKLTQKLISLEQYDKIVEKYKVKISEKK